MRHSSAGVEARRSSVDSAEGFDEVSIVGPHWEPPADRLANGEGDMLDYMMVRRCLLPSFGHFLRIYPYFLYILSSTDFFLDN